MRDKYRAIAPIPELEPFRAAEREAAEKDRADRFYELRRIARWTGLLLVAFFLLVKPPATLTTILYTIPFTGLLWAVACGIDAVMMYLITEWRENRLRGVGQVAVVYLAVIGGFVLFFWLLG